MSVYMRLSRRWAWFPFLLSFWNVPAKSASVAERSDPGESEKMLSSAQNFVLEHQLLLPHGQRWNRWVSHCGVSLERASLRHREGVAPGLMEVQTSGTHPRGLGAGFALRSRALMKL